MALNLIFASDYKGLIGNGNALPFRSKKDMAFFKQTTMGHTVVMGRKTWDSLPETSKPLSGRNNLILSRTMQFDPQVSGVKNTTIGEVLALAKTEDVFVIGGAEIYKEFYPYTDRIYHSIIRGEFEGDVHFPIEPMDISENFILSDMKLDIEADFYVLERRRGSKAPILYLIELEDGVINDIEHAVFDNDVEAEHAAQIMLAERFPDNEDAVAHFYRLSTVDGYDITLTKRSGD